MTDPPTRLEGLTGHGDLLVAPGRPMLVGRGAAADLVVADPAVSRHHAEIQVTAEGLRVRDLGSANGCFLNGAPIVEAILRPGDILTIGRPAFRLVGATSGTPDQELPPSTSWRGVPADASAIRDPDALQRLVALARTLSGRFDVDRLTADIADLAFEVVPAERVALLLLQGPGQDLVPVQSRSRVGEASAVQVPRAIARRALEQRRPVVTEDALDDSRLQSGSVVAARVRGAIAAPLLADDEHVIGVLYADRIASPVPFTDAEANLLLAFAGLAAVSLAKLELAATVQRQADTRRNLERFFAPEVAAQIAAAGEPLGAGGERRTVTVLFNDLRGFTGLAESLAPEQVAAILTEYFTAMAAVVFAHGGTLDKFVGDGLLAVWGAPLGVPDDAGSALRAARAMREALAGLNRAWATRSQPVLEAGMGLARGEVFAGRLGSDHRLEYTVIGDAVNVAARLCDRAGAGEILLTREVRDRLADQTGLSPRPGPPLRGRAGEVEVWQA